MATAQDVLRVAQAEIGYVEQGGSTGHNGNITKYWADLQPSFQGQPWCAAFVSYVFKHAGAPLPAIDKPWGYSYVPSLVAYAKAHNLWDESGHYSPCDIIAFRYSGSVADHTGIVESDDGKTIVTIEGNTTPQGLSGSQTNGGCVARKIHPHGAVVLGVMKTASLLAASSQEDDLPSTTDMLKALDAAAVSTEHGTPVPGTQFIDAIARRVVAMQAAAAAAAKK